MEGRRKMRKPGDRKSAEACEEQGDRKPVMDRAFTIGKQAMGD
jgi:hypothetical protein